MVKSMDKEYPPVSEYGPNKYPDIPLRVTDADFNTLTKNYPVVVIDCWAPWCGPCRALSPLIDELAKELQNKIVFAKLNTDENQETAIKYHIMSIPTLLVFKEGELKDQIVGLLPKDQIASKLKDFM
ncbi:MAG: thioredoxin [Thermoplasmata archaeon]|nr:MAG: thioredoxin [Thermoplasmata archaeon]